MQQNLKVILSFFQSGYQFYKKVLDNPWLKYPIQGVILTFCGLYLWSNLRDLQNQTNTFSIKFGPLILSFIFVFIAIYSGALTWWIVLKSLGQSIGSLEAGKVHLISNLTKYVPGFAWQLISKVFQTSEKGVRGRIASLGMSIEVVQLLLVGLLISFALFPSSVLTRLELPFSNYWVNIAGSLFISACLLIFPLSIRQMFSGNINLSILWLHTSSIVMFVGWMCYGFSFWLLSAAIGGLTINEMPLLIFTLTSSVVIGLLIIVIPNSIGVRESIMVWLIGPVMGGNLAVLIAIMSRVLVLLCEVIWVGIVKIIDTIKVDENY